MPLLNVEYMEPVGFRGLCQDIHGIIRSDKQGASDIDEGAIPCPNEERSKGYFEAGGHAREKTALALKCASSFTSHSSKPTQVLRQMKPTRAQPDVRGPFPYSLGTRETATPLDINVEPIYKPPSGH
jgi:hypothetical protein